MAPSRSKPKRISVAGRSSEWPRATGRFLPTTSSIATRPTNVEHLLRHQHTCLCQQADGQDDRARKLFASGGKLSVQVLNEFMAVSRRKQRRVWREIDEAVADVLTTADPPLAITLDLHISERALAEDHLLTFYDALILASAIDAGSDTPYSEDMQHRRTIDS